MIKHVNTYINLDQEVELVDDLGKFSIFMILETSLYL